MMCGTLNGLSLYSAGFGMMVPFCRGKTESGMSNDELDFRSLLLTQQRAEPVLNSDQHDSQV